MKQVIYTLFTLIIVAVAGYIFVNYYSYIFAKDIVGVIENVEKPVNPVTVVDTGSGNGANAMERMYFSYAVAIKDTKTGEIYTSSSEDRQWAVADKGKCVEARFYPNAPWNFEKSGTYFGARLLRMYDCPSE